MKDDCPECELCCALGICCPPGSAQQRVAVARMLMANGSGAEHAQSVADAFADAHAAHVEKMKASK